VPAVGSAAPVLVMSYWRSAEHLRRFAADAESPHLQPWRDFNRQVGDDGTVGVWHETYVTRPGQREVIYVNMPAFGLGEAIGAHPVGPGAATAAQRMTGQGAGRVRLPDAGQPPTIGTGSTSSDRARPKT